MNKLTTDARLGQADSVSALKLRIQELQRENAILVNAMSEGRIAACTNAMAAAPATGSYTPGDFVRNSAPAELGAAGAKYVVEGWLCTAAPLTFVPKRFLTGN